MSVPQAEEAVLLGGANFSPWMIYDICRETGVRSLSVYVPGRDLVKACRKTLEEARVNLHFKLPERFQLKEREEIRKIGAFPPDCALVFDLLNETGSLELLYEMADRKPTYLFGALHAGKTSSFEIWDAYRKYCRTVYILTWAEDRRTEALSWERRPGNDTELSVIFPIYNVEQYLPQCIETATAWDAEYIEFLFVDDGSPDRCAEIVRDAAQKDRRIKLLQKPNGGCASARQYGLEHAKGRYIGFIDPDDYIDPSMYRKLFRRAMVGGYEICYGGYKEVYTETGETREASDLLGQPYRSGTVDPAAILDLCAFCRVAIWRSIFSADMIARGKLHFYTDLRRFDDLPFKFETFATARSVASVPEYLYYYRLARPGQDVSANDERLYVHFTIFQYLDRFVQEKGAYDLLELLQIVKLHTHRYALQKLLPRYVKEYLRQAHRDLLRNLPLGQILAIYAGRASRGDRAYFWAILLESPLMIRLLARRSERKEARRQRKAEKLVRRLEKFRKDGSG